MLFICVYVNTTFPELMMLSYNHFIKPCPTDAPSFYIAFLKSSVGDPCQNDSCMNELGFNLFVIFGKKERSFDCNNSGPLLEWIE